MRWLAISGFERRKSVLSEARCYFDLADAIRGQIDEKEIYQQRYYLASTTYAKRPMKHICSRGYIIHRGIGKTLKVEGGAEYYEQAKTDDD